MVSYLCRPVKSSFISGSSSFGRARPCQGRGGRFEPGLPLTIIVPSLSGFFFKMCHSGGGTGRHAGLKILFSATRVWVQLPSRVQSPFIGTFLFLPVLLLMLLLLSEIFLQKMHLISTIFLLVFCFTNNPAVYLSYNSNRNSILLFSFMKGWCG